MDNVHRACRNARDLIPDKLVAAHRTRHVERPRHGKYFPSLVKRPAGRNHRARARRRLDDQRCGRQAAQNTVADWKAEPFMGCARRIFANHCAG